MHVHDLTVIITISLICAIGTVNSVGVEESQDPPAHSDNHVEKKDQVVLGTFNISKSNAAEASQGNSNHRQADAAVANNVQPQVEFQPPVPKQQIPEAAAAKPGNNTTIFKKISDNTDDDFPGHAPHVTEELDSGALMRGFYVFLGLSTITVMYLLYRSIRVRSSQAPQTYRKYGVRTRRGDVEMLPLPLDDEDDDETVFDMGSHAASSSKGML